MEFKKATLKIGTCDYQDHKNGVRIFFGLAKNSKKHFLIGNYICTKI